MPRKINAHATFKALRHLPLAVSYEQVEQWVAVSNPIAQSVEKRSWLERLRAWWNK